MARNRKSQSVTVRFGPVVKAVVICVLIGGSGVGYVWQKEQIVRLGRQISAREGRLKFVEDENDKLRKQLSRMRSVGFLESRIKELNLGLMPPQPAQVWHLPEPQNEPLVLKPDRQLAEAGHAPSPP